MRLGILLTRSPLHEEARTVRVLASEAAARGHTVQIFLMGEGLYNILDPEFLKLRGKADIQACGVNREALGVPKTEGIRFTGQYDHALLVNGCDRFLHF
ncbi:MAG: DsrE family protein [Halobacteria archaeon]